MSWSDTRRTLRKDHRWESGSLLEREEKEKLFNEHIEALTKKKREHFRQLLDETSAVRPLQSHAPRLCQPIVTFLSWFSVTQSDQVVLISRAPLLHPHLLFFMTQFVHYLSVPVHLGCCFGLPYRSFTFELLTRDHFISAGWCISPALRYLSLLLSGTCFFIVLALTSLNECRVFQAHLL